MARPKDSYEFAGPAFIGSIIGGFGIGMAYDRPWIGLLIGLGIGFVLMALVAAHK
jgi:hypothetical protein